MPAIAAAPVRAAAKPAVARPSRQALVVRAQAKAQKPQQNLAQKAAAMFVAVTLLAAPAMAAGEDVDTKIKATICAANPTAKVCLANSSK